MRRVWVVCVGWSCCMRVCLWGGEARVQVRVFTHRNLARKRSDQRVFAVGASNATLLLIEFDNVRFLVEQTNEPVAGGGRSAAQKEAWKRKKALQAMVQGGQSLLDDSLQKLPGGAASW